MHRKPFGLKKQKGIIPSVSSVLFGAFRVPEKYAQIENRWVCA
jgi:hypothetical protein